MVFYDIIFIAPELTLSRNGGAYMDNKSLAVELTKSYTASLLAIKDSNGNTAYPLTEKDVIKVLKDFYDAIKNLD